MRLKNNKQKSKQTKEESESVASDDSSNRKALLSGGKRKILAVFIVLTAAVGIGVYAYVAFRTQPSSPAQEVAPEQQTEEDEITPPGTIYVTPEVPEGIEHEEQRPAAGG